jgi:two-component system LytT family sensor kinase
MKKSILCNFSVLIGVLFLSNHDANAQTAVEIDSLNAIIEYGNDSLKIDALNELSILFCESDLLRAEMNARNAIALSKKTGSQSLLARSMLRLGSVYDYKEKFDSASMVYYQALRIAESINDSLTMAKIYMNIGVMHYFQGNINEADKFYLLSAGLFSRLGNDENLSKVYNNLGTVRRKQNNYDEAISYYNKSLQLKKKLNDIRGANKTYFNIAIVYEYKGLFDSSIAIIKQSILFDQSKKDFFSLTHDYITLGEIYTRKNDLVNALANYDTAIILLKSYPSNYLSIKVYQGKLSVDTLLNNYKDALYHSQKITEYKDLLYNEEINSKTATIAAIYENEKKEEKIKLQTKQLKQKNVILILGLILLGLISVLAGVIYYSLQRKKKDNLLLSKQKREIEAKTEQVKNQAEEIARHQSQMNPHFVYNALGSIQNIIADNKLVLANEQISEFAKLMRATLNNADKRYITLEEEIDFLKRYIFF